MVRQRGVVSISGRADRPYGGGGIAVRGGPGLLLSSQFIFLESRNNRLGAWYYRFMTPIGTAAMPGTTTIYDPPKEGLPYLVVTFTPDGLKITAANSSLSARTIASEGVFRRRSERQSEQSKASAR
jgi:hypothetical protein